jgi:predicted DCC family thiol-disulfide oxidoreductase YuxK
MKTLDVNLDRHSYLLFDGDCGICTYLSGIAGGIDKRDEFEIVPYQSIPETELAKFGISYDGCTKRIYVISRTGRVHPGAFGVNSFLIHYLPWSIAVILLYLLPPLLLAELIVYRLVANNRHHISRWFGLKACTLK